MRLRPKPSVQPLKAKYAPAGCAWLRLTVGLQDVLVIVDDLLPDCPNLVLGAKFTAQLFSYPTYN